MSDGLVLYVYRCAACGSPGETHLPDDLHDGADGTCGQCGASVQLEWDGGVTLHPVPSRNATTNLKLRKGMRVRAEWLEGQPVDRVALPSVQTKIGAAMRQMEGVIAHLRGDHPTHPTSIGVWLTTDSGEEIVTDARHIVAVLAGGNGS